MPVHLGSMDRSVETIIRDQRRAASAPGDVFALNAPYNGGTHLPDITVCTPVFDEKGEDDPVLGRLARPPRRCRRHFAGLDEPARDHHPSRRASISTISCSSTRGALPRDASSTRCSTGGPYPARNPLQNVNDLKAQIAANEKGAQELKRMVETFSLETVEAYMGHVQDNAAESVRRVIDRLKDSEFRDEMDQGAVIKVQDHASTRQKREATVDFTGTSPQQPTNFNAPEPVARAAVLYVFRVMVEDDIPMNAGLPAADPHHHPGGLDAVAALSGRGRRRQCRDQPGGDRYAVRRARRARLRAGHDEQPDLRQRRRYQYYETICSGAPAGPGFDGASGVHTHMTNSRLTDPEVLEFRFPVVLEDFHIRRGSGGKGRWRAGDGTLRRLRFLERWRRRF